MTAHRRRVAPSRLVVLGVVALGLGVAACQPATTSPAPTGSSPASRTPGSQLSLPPDRSGLPGPGGSIHVGPPTMDVQGFGRIWDGLPASFPKLPGQEPADESEPASGSFATLSSDARQASQSMEAALRGQGWQVDAGSPLEDGSIVVEATGTTSGCRAELRFTPVNGTVIMEVLYGASCPFS